MNTMRYLIAAISVALMTGCATQFQDYEGTAQRTALANICEREGFISREAFQSYLSFQFGGYANQWVVDQDKLRSMYLDKVASFPLTGSITSSDKQKLNMYCAEIATIAQRVSPNNSAKQNLSNEIYENKNTVECKKIGEFINVEIKTFSGMVCPLGWLPDY